MREENFTTYIVLCLSHRNFFFLSNRTHLTFLYCNIIFIKLDVWNDVTVVKMLQLLLSRKNAREMQLLPIYGKDGQDFGGVGG